MSAAKEATMDNLSDDFIFLALEDVNTPSIATTGPVL
jgi:hypothetical protein